MKWKNFRFSLMKGNKRYLLFNGHRRAGREQRCCWTPAGQGWCKKLFQNQMGVTSIKYFIKLTVGLLNITSCRRSLMSLSAQTIPWFCEERFSWPSISTMWFCNDFLIFWVHFLPHQPVGSVRNQRIRERFGLANLEEVPKFWSILCEFPFPHGKQTGFNGISEGFPCTAELLLLIHVLTHPYPFTTVPLKKNIWGIWLSCSYKCLQRWHNMDVTVEKRK